VNKMEQEFLRILRSALRGEHYTDAGLTAVEWREIFRLAQIHTVLPLVYEAVYDSPSLKHGAMPELAVIRMQVRHQVMVQTVKTAEFQALYDNWIKAGVRPLVVKGIVCRSLYPVPDLRSSGDEDVLVEPGQLQRCCEEMVRFGMKTELDAEAAAGSYEIPYRKCDGMLYVELHKHLFPPASNAYGAWNRFFHTVFDHPMEVQVQGSKVYTMAPTEGLFYLICHAFKHFFHSGFGIRQVCDIVLYAQRYGAEIRWERFWKDCRRIRGEQFAAALLTIGEKYLGFDPVQAGCADYRTRLRTDEQRMLADLLDGGLYGDVTLSRKHSSNITLDAVMASSQGKIAGTSVMGSMFPPPGKLTHRYAYLKKYPWLVPVAWADRLIQYRRETRSTANSDVLEAIRIGSQRVELFRQYDIID
jgi:hypothetical protein